MIYTLKKVTNTMSTKPGTGPSMLTRIKIKDITDLEYIKEELAKKRNDIYSKADAISYLIELGLEKVNSMKQI